LPFAPTWLSVPRDRAASLLIASRFDFLAVQTPPGDSITERVYRVGENILISLLILAHNTQALRRDILLRDRVRIVLRRSTLEQRYGLLRPGAGAEPRVSSRGCKDAKSGPMARPPVADHSP
jgi:hypothetical protein